VSHGEAIHTSTFLGNPVACEAALAQLAEVEERALLARAVNVGGVIRERVLEWQRRFDVVGTVRGRGLLQGVPLRGERKALDVAARAMQQGVLVLAEGPAADVLALTPPAVITDEQLDAALDIIERSIAES
jgi:4-aminobutyrate aminotransferase-like enzyme